MVAEEIHPGETQFAVPYKYRQRASIHIGSRPLGVALGATTRWSMLRSPHNWLHRATAKRSREGSAGNFPEFDQQEQPTTTNRLNWTRKTGRPPSHVASGQSAANIECAKAEDSTPNLSNPLLPSVCLLGIILALL